MASHSIPPESFLIIVGSMKCGTTTLFDYLAKHDQICPAYHKEPEFFTVDMKAEPLEAYEDLWPDYDPAQHRYVMEGSTGYTKQMMEPNVPQAMYDYGIRPKLLYIIRDPYKRLESSFNFMQQFRTYNGQIDHPINIAICKYYDNLERYVRVFGREAIHVLRFEDFVRRDETTMAELFEFLDLPDTLADVEMEKSNVTSVPPSRLFKRLRNALPKGLRDMIPSGLKEMALKTDGKVVQREKYTLTEAQRAHVAAELKEDMANLKRHYGIDTSAWGF